MDEYLFYKVQITETNRRTGKIRRWLYNKANEYTLMSYDDAHEECERLKKNRNKAYKYEGKVVRFIGTVIS